MTKNEGKIPKLIYFSGCPNAEKLEKILREIGVKYVAICQDKLAHGDYHKAFSSPTLILNNEILIGYKTQNKACTSKIPSKEEIVTMIEESI